MSKLIPMENYGMKCIRGIFPSLIRLGIVFSYTPHWHNYYNQLKRLMQITLESLCTRKFMCSSVACCRGCCRLCVRTYHKFISSTAQASSCAMLYKSQIVKLHVLVCTCMCKQHGTFLPSQWRSTSEEKELTKTWCSFVGESWMLTKHKADKQTSWWIWASTWSVKIAHNVERTGQEYLQSTMGKCAWGNMGKYGQ